MPATGRHSGLGIGQKQDGCASVRIKFTIDTKNSSPKISSPRGSSFLKLPKGEHSRRNSSPKQGEVDISFTSFRKKDYRHTAGLKLPTSESPSSKRQAFVVAGIPMHASTGQLTRPLKIPVLIDPPFVKQNRQVKIGTKHFLSVQADAKPPTAKGLTSKQI